jgi:hypothetical protein
MPPGSERHTWEHTQPTWTLQAGRHSPQTQLPYATALTLSLLRSQRRRIHSAITLWCIHSWITWDELLQFTYFPTEVWQAESTNSLLATRAVKHSGHPEFALVVQEPTYTNGDATYRCRVVAPSEPLHETLHLSTPACDVTSLTSILDTWQDHVLGLEGGLQDFISATPRRHTVSVTVCSV